MDYVQLRLLHDGSFMIKTYYLLMKPGIIFGNILTAASGFALASQGNINYPLLFITLMGLGFVIASACVFNNYIDRDMDAKMERTRSRGIASGLISIPKALLFAFMLGVIGFSILSYTNLLTILTAFTGFFVYLVLYAFMKYRSFYGTLMGSVAGAIPPVVGYCAVSNQFDLGALILFMIVVLWQMPHFFAIAIYRIDDYAEASIPVLPIEKGLYVTKVHMMLYIIAFMLTTFLLTATGYTGSLYALVTLLLSLGWVALCIKGFLAQNHKQWAYKMFVYSLVVIMGWCFIIPFDSVSAKETVSLIGSK